MPMLIRCASTTCPHPIILGSILDDGTLRQLIRGNKFHVRRGEVTLGHRECGYEKTIIVPAPIEDFKP